MSQVNHQNDSNNVHVDVKETITVNDLTAKTSVRTNVTNCNILHITNSLTAGTEPETQTIVETGSWNILDTVEIEENIESVDLPMASATYFSNGRFVYLQIPFVLVITEGEGPIVPASFTFEAPVDPDGGEFSSSSQAVGLYSDFVPIIAHASAVVGTNRILVTIDECSVLEPFVLMRIMYKI